VSGRERNDEYLARARRVIPSATQTFSKGPTQFVQGVAPTFLMQGAGCRVRDVDGREYLDNSMALGAVSLGYGYERVNAAVERQLRNGGSFSLPHPLEVEVAELLVDTIPCAEMVRFGKNGSDATAGAVRLARAVTGREVIACCGYHGWQDWYIGTTTRSAGVPEAVKPLTVQFVYNDLGSLERVFAEHSGAVAAVIMEPMGVLPPDDGFLELVRDLAHREGALLVYDEILTGFRVGLGGAQEHFDITPDLGCFGKAMANGFPVSAVVGRRDLMEVFDEVFFSFTFGGDAFALAATLATVSEYRERDVVAHLWDVGGRLRDGFNELAHAAGLADTASCVGLPPRNVTIFRDESGAESLLAKSLFQQECLKRGVLFTGAHNPSFSHGDADIDETLGVYAEAFAVLTRSGGALERALEGEPVEHVFRQA
jgi:glutamate-1-semialdehyde aminotransferase